MLFYIPYFLLFFIIRLLLSYNKRFITTLLGVGMGCWYLIESVECILQLFSVHASKHTNFVFTGNFDNPGPLGGFLAVIGTIAATYIIINRDTCNKVSKYFCGVIVALLIILLPASMSRAAWLSCGCAILICLSVEFDIWYYIKRHRFLSVLSLAVLILLIIGSFYLKQDSALGRFHIWKIELRAILEDPIDGYGAGNALGAYGDAQARYFKLGMGDESDIAIAGCPEYAFNELLKIGVERGVFVMFAVFMATLFCLFRLIKINPPLSYGMLALCIFSMSSYPFSLWQFRVLFTLFVAIALQNHSESKILIRADRIISFALFTILLCFGGEYVSYQKTRNNTIEEWKSIRNLASYEKYEDITEELEPLLPILKDNFRYMYDYGYALHKCGRYDKSNEILEQGSKISSDPMFHNIIGKNYEGMGLYILAEREYEYSHYMVPCRLYPLVLLLELYLKQGEIIEAEKILNKINKMPINERNRAMVDLKRRANAVYNKGIIDVENSKTNN